MKRPSSTPYWLIAASIVWSSCSVTSFVPRRADGGWTRTSSSSSCWSMTTTASSSSSSSETYNPFLLEDSSGHINPELAQRIWKWEQEQRLQWKIHGDHQGISTREGLRWVQEAVHHATQDNYDDWIQEGVMALLQAMQDYEKKTNRRQSFAEYCQSKIAQALEDYSWQQRSSGPRSLSVESTVEIADKMGTHYSNQDEWEVREGLVLDNGQGEGLQTEALVEEYMDESVQYEGEDQMWVHQQQVAAPLKDSIPDPSFGSLWMEEYDDDDATQGEEQGNSIDNVILTDMIRYNVDEFLGSTLGDLESQIILLRFGLEESSSPRTQKEVAEDLGITVGKVRKLQKQALGKLRKAYASRYLAGTESQDEDYWQDSV